MNKTHVQRLEELLERALTEEETARLLRIKTTLEIDDNDALWDVLAAMEYQRAYYEELPQKIAGVSAEILKKIGTAQGSGASPLRLSSASRLEAAALLPLAFTFLAALLLYGSLLMWTGFCLGSGQAHPPELMLRMPSGLIMGGLCLMGGFLLGVRAAKNFAEGEKGWRKPMLAALALLLPGGAIVSLAL
jgi:hypothetical protein